MADTTDRAGAALAIGDIVTVEMVVTGLPINTGATKMVALSQTDEGEGPIALTCPAVYVTRKEDQTPQGGAVEPEPAAPTT